MKRTKIKCPDCGIEISASNITKHLNSKACLTNQKKLAYGDECPWCGLNYIDSNNYQKAIHIRWCKNNPDRKHFEESLKSARDTIDTAWNKGLTKETDDRLKQTSETYKRRIKNGKIIPSFLGKHHSDETKQLLKERALANDYQRVNKNTLTYITVTGETVMLDSEWERTVAKNLDNANIKWIRPKPLKWYDSEGWRHNYFSDFYIPEWDVYLDPKNDWVEIDQKEKLDYLRLNYDNIFILKKHQLDIESIKNLIGA